MNLSYQNETWENIAVEVEALAGEELYSEVTPIPLTGHFAYETYDMLYKIGMLFVLTARIEETLVGVYIALIDNHLNFSKCRFASPSIYYVRKAYRGEGIGKTLFTMAETQLKAKGVNVIFCGTKTYLPFSAFFEHLDYRPVETVYMKVLS